MNSCSYQDFQRVEMHIGQIVRVELFPKAKKPAYKLWIDLGADLGVKQSSAQITKRYRPAELEGRKIVAVTNLLPKKIANFESEVLVLGVDSLEGGVTLLGIDHDAPPGSRVY